MKISAVILLISLWFLRVKITNANYRRIIRGPPQPPRPPPNQMQQFKKWPVPQHPPRPQIRPRPIPIHMSPNFKAPVGPPVPVRHPLPIRATWKNTQPFQMASEKPFLSSPNIGISEYDYQVQTNNIPNHSNTIKQVDDKGPIHTIPAPNLSPADRPNNINQIKNIPQAYQNHHPIQQQMQIHQQALQQHQHQQQQQQQQQQQLQHQQQQQQQQLQSQSQVHQQQLPQQTIVEIQKSHQYQVTEPNEYSQRGQPVYFAPDPSSAQDNNVPIRSEQLNNLPRAEFLVAPQQDQITGMTEQDLYKLLNMYPQQQLLDTYGVPILQQPQLQQHLIQRQQTAAPNYQLLLNDPQIYQQNLNQHNKSPARPQYQIFNYDEQEQRTSANQLSSRVTGEYNVKPATYDNANDNPLEALAQAQYVQHFFGNRDESITNSIAEPDAQPTNLPQTNTYEDNETPKEEIASAFYSTLPSRQAAETLASLQEAGKLNNVPHQQNTIEAQNQLPISIYVPDNYDDSGDESNEDISKEDNPGSSSEQLEYDNPPEKDDDKEQYLYGTRLRPKNK